MFGIHNGLVRADDGVNILKEHNPREDRMRKPCFGGLFVVFAKISSSVEEFLRLDRCLELHRVAPENEWLSRRPRRFRALLQRIVERGTRGVKAAVTILEQPAHL